MGGLLAPVEGLGCESHDSIRVARVQILTSPFLRDVTLKTLPPLPMPFPPPHTEWKENRALHEGLHSELMVLSSKPVPFWLLGPEWTLRTCLFLHRATPNKTQVNLNKAHREESLS